MPSRIEDYALIGDCESAALVSRDGSIDWLCWPRFDSDACFAALLGTPEHGRFQHRAAATTSTRITRRYRPDTLILETTLRDRRRRRHADRLHADPRHAIRTACASCVGERGRVPMCVELVLRFGYGAIVPWVRKLGDGTLRAIAGPDMVVLRTPVHLRGENMTTVGEFTVGEGDRVPFVLSYGPSHLPVPEAFAADAALKDTESYWQEWTRKGRVHGPWSDAVARSLITLKALTYGPTGGIVAAPTTSLPERIGGNRNWDYRYLLGARRDADAARADERRLLRGSAGLARLADARGRGTARADGGDVRRRGRAAAHRMGSAVASRLRELRAGAHRQRGAPAAAARRVRRGDGHAASGPPRRPAGERSPAGTCRSRCSIIWQRSGASRTTASGRCAAEPMHFTYSKAMAWVAFDRAHQERRDVRPAGPGRALARTVRRDPRRRLRQGWNEKRNSFMRSYGSNDLDASLLLLAPIGFIKPDDPRYRGTVEAIERDLIVDGLVLRYDSRQVEGRPAAGRRRVPRLQLLARRRLSAARPPRRCRAPVRAAGRACNDVGLLSEEYDPRAKRHARQFPAGLLARRADQHGLQPDARREAGRAALRTAEGNGESRQAAASA